MEDYCAFSKKHKCIIWNDYALSRFELEEANTLCHGNWTEIQHLYDRVYQLELFIKSNGLPVPDEPD